MCTPQGIIEHLGCMVFDEAVKAVTKAGKYVCHYRTNLDNLQREMTFLEDRRKIIEREANEAIGRGEVIEEDVAHWRTDTNTMKIYVYLMRQSTCSSLNIKWRYRLSKQAEENIEAVKKLAQGSHFDKISHPKPPPPELEFPSAENYIHLDSRTPILEDIVGALRDPNVEMIGVHGLGGVGKTTLVEKVAKKLLDAGTFKQVPLVAVSKDHNVKDIQKKLADKLNFTLDARKDENGRAIELWNKFKNGEKYLVILDDIWEKVDLKAIGIPVMEGHIGCKVVLTSRKEDLLRITMKVDRNFPIAVLPEEEGWNLFKKKVGNTIESRPEIDSLAREVCRKCKGLPVAINALGAALEDRPYHTWKNALDKLERHMLTHIEGIDPSVWASLWVSFDMLQSSDAQSCFLLCCLFAEDAEIPIDELMRHCMARSLLAQNPRTFDEARTAMCTVVDVLKSASLLSTGDHETVVKIHDVIRDVGISIAREKEAFLVDHGALRLPQNPTNGPSYKAMSLSFKSIKGLSDGLVYPELHTLMVANSELSDLEFPDNFFNGMMQLKVLTITGIRMRRLPSSLAKLKNLRMLYLNECKLDDIAVLEDLKSNLEVLEVLSLKGSNIEALPPEIGQLTSLRVLDFQDCDKLMVIPRGVISNLTGLEELYFPMTFDKWEATTDEQQDTSSRDNVSLEELRESLANAQLTTLHIHVPNVELLPKEDLKLADLKGFRISVGSEFDYFEALISRTCMLKLEGIQLRNKFIPLVDKAEVLILKLESSVHPLQLFNKLTVLSIEQFKLKYLFSPTTARGLVHLEVLKVTSCEIIEGIVGFERQKDENEITGEVKFSKLKQLKLTSLPNLISFFAEKEEMGTTMGSFSARAQPLFNEQVIFPALEELTIDELGNIIKIWDKQSIAVLEEQGSFCQVKSVDVRRCAKLMHVFPSNMHPQLKNLERLEVYRCETLKGIAEFEGEIDEDGLRNEVTSPAQEHLEMVRITEIQDKQPLPEPKKEVESLCKLTDICINKCDQLLYVFPSHMLPLNLEELEIEDCDELEVIFSKDPKEEKEAINDDIIVFPRLKKVRLWKLPKLKSFYTETQGFFSHKVICPVLECLIINGLGNIIKIWEKQSIAVLEEQESFCKLEDLQVTSCSKLMHVFPSNMHPLLKNLKTLQVNSCETMKGIAEFEREIDEDGLRNEVASSAREHLEMVGVTEIYIMKCDQLLYVFPSHMLTQNLQGLRIENCDELEVIFSKDPKEEKEAINDDIIVFPRLKHVSLLELPKLKSFYTETQGFFSHKVAFPVLETLNFWNLSKITRIWDEQPLSEPEKEAKSFFKLTNLSVVGCEDLEYVLPLYMLRQLMILQSLTITGCTKMEVIISNNLKEKEATNNNHTIRFPQLKTLELEDLPNLKSFICGETRLFFSDKVIFPVLNKLSIRKMHKIIEIWDKQSIAVLEEHGSFCQLTNLDVSKCEKLMHVFPSKMHSPLKNLKVLCVSDCPTMEGIVEFEGEIDEDGLRNEVCFSKLSSLKLSSLPNLESFCTKLGKAGTTEGNCTIHALPLFNGKVAFPVLETLNFWNLSKITRIWDEQPLSEPEKEAKSFFKLTNLSVVGCEDLEYVLPLYMLRQLMILQSLTITGCTKMEVIISNNLKEKEATNNNHTIRFPQLKTLELEDLPNLKSFICGETRLFFSDKVIFPVLNKLSIRKMHKIIEIWDKQSIAVLEEHGSFCQLTNLDVSKCEKLMHVFPSKMHSPLKNLKVLCVSDCPTMEGIVEFEGEIDEDGLRNEVCFSKLSSLKLSSLPNLESFCTKLGKAGTTEGNCTIHALPLFNGKVAFPVLETLNFWNLSKITRIWDEQPLSEPEKEAKSFFKLTNLSVVGCEDLEYVLPLYMLRQLMILQSLTITGCTKMEVIISNNLKEKEATNNNHTIRFPQLKTLELEDLPNLKSFICGETRLFFSDKVIFPVLNKLSIRKMHKIIEIWDKQSIAVLEEHGSFCQLTNLDVSKCEKLMHVFPSKMHSPLKNLKVLCVSDCPTMEEIVEFEGEIDEDGLRNEVCFSKLSSLKLSSLPNLESFCTKLGKAGTTEGNCTIHALPLFNGKVAFPVLESLDFRNLSKITRIWDEQPLSEQEKEAKSFCKLMEIKVEDCDQLEYVLPLYMLPQLKNLQRLDIWDCWKMEVIISTNPKQKEATNNNDTIRFPRLEKVSFWGMPNLKSFICCETQLFFSNKDAFPVLEEIDLDEDSEILENNKMADTSAAQARKGKDIQGIPWERLNITREKYRQTRLEQYKNYEGIPQSGKRSEKDCKVTMKGGMYYEFRRNSRSVKSTIPHHQLRNLVWATSKHDIYFMSHFSVTHWSALTCNKTEVLNVSGHVAPCEKHPGSLLEGFTPTKVSTLAVKDRLLVAGGFKGELICKNLDRPGVCFCTRTTFDDNAITNVVEIYSTQSGAVHFTAANNDCGFRDFDMENFQLSKHFSFPWPVNHTSLSPDGKLRIIVGDNPEGMLVDSGTGKMVASLVGHLDFSFASAWHPDGLTFATGNQDKTCRIWDARNLSKSVAALKGNLGAIYSIRYSSDGCFMAMAEPADFVHVFDAKSGYEKEQEIDFFGEISGMSFSPDTESLFIGVCNPTEGGLLGVWDPRYGRGLLEFGRRRNNSCPDSMI
ncbi:uncharacterized protein LOC131320819 isoform X1 [Rhododendron vialii]|uniref:uncharacterized protein LOC131320819 isoform X1 n=1 Tax=Rhododendron vialii TaxID=182163 RepID=UPI00265D68B7|nr:uncharacterized protein LOC131320819 isoform X1 [Rhododendron vialii]